ncbi:MarC family protein [Moraxella catarrhalis]|uniref:MarC family protein n=1 Tax=Moraxella catarrhalis TaxID=480 RepID=UPI0002029B96|nr:MarC family protein [Moraxella catarrhalis]AZQ87717.1 marC integral membrane family protein [Moraxella catarrhalis]AZQ91204.1 marC integral membrane family protein [Moraxella catarrhalis]EGE27035.1 multiple antibiotic resistance (MarC)-related protein [Moraxella catarrhalis O35E]MPW77561.1 MarC family protein [Moraxella catarrhalis]MPW89265.1 MarC family protein [Moraxella catarrhalis]
MEVEIIKIILAFIVLINPSAALAMFVNFTHGYSYEDKRRVARIASATVFIAIAFFSLFGEIMLRGLGISLGSFRVAGGILLFLIALGMMNDGNNPVKPNEDELELSQPKAKDPSSLTGIAVVPLAIPMMVGPGGISTVIIYSSQVSGIVGMSLIIVAGLCISILCYLSLMAAGQISKLLGDTGLNIINRIMGIILAAVAIEIVVAGLRTIFPNLL